jgi:hypothetical protein
MNAPSLFPAPSEADSFAVKHALEVARSLWDCGEHRQAIVWVERAAAAADQAGDASRVALLARAVADLGAPATLPPPPLPHAPGSSTVPPPARSTVPPPLPSRAQAKPRLLPPPPPPPSPAPPPGSEVRRRVSVKVSVRDPDLLVVRPLADGESAPAGTREAFLVMVER